MIKMFVRIYVATGVRVYVIDLVILQAPQCPYSPSSTQSGTPRYLLTLERHCLHSKQGPSIAPKYKYEPADKIPLSSTVKYVLRGMSVFELLVSGI
jgi:hypothetical protein